MTVIDHGEMHLSALMRDGSRAEHESAEGSSFMSELLAGRIAAHGYADYLSRLRRVYAALEEAGRRMAADPIGSAVVDPALERLAAIDADLDHWGAGDATSPATDAYVARLQHAAAWGGTFVAHHYTRYLGDLSGGRAIGRILQRSFDLEVDGVRFYAFDQVPKPKPYKDAYRARLDALELTAAQKGEILDEVKVAFGLNQALFDELGADLDRYRR
jgi:heme oxygenase